MSYIGTSIFRRCSSKTSYLPLWQIGTYVVFENFIDVRKKTRNCHFGKRNLRDFRRNRRCSSKTTYVPCFKNGTYVVFEEHRRFGGLVP